MDSVTQILLGASVGVAVMGRRTAVWKSALWGGVAGLLPDLRARHWTEESLVIANSFGAYLFLHAQSELPQYVGRVVLLSPIVGEFGDSESMMNFIPPRSNRLFDLVSDGRFIVPNRLEIYVGQEDCLCI